jgi:hypothetical protein
MASDLGAAVIGVIGTLGGGALSMLGTSFTSRRDREAHKSDRLWENRRDAYFSVLQWVATVDKQLGDIIYTFNDYVEADFASPDDEWPRPILTKRSEYRTYIHPSRWQLPMELNETTRVRVLALESSPRLLQAMDDAAQSSVSMADEARSLGVNTIKDRNRTEESVRYAREVLGRLFNTWSEQSRIVVALVRSELEIHDREAGGHGERLAK